MGSKRLTQNGIANTNSMVQLYNWTAGRQIDRSTGFDQPG
jgi:hypothetical protein